MFKLFKSFFKKEKIQSFSQSVNETISFMDLKNQPILIGLQYHVNGNVLIIQEQKSGIELTIDKERALLLGIALQEYSKTNSLSTFMELIK